MNQSIIKIEILQLQHFQPPDISKWMYHWTRNNKTQTNQLKWPSTAFFFKCMKTDSIKLSNIWDGIYWRDTQKQMLSPQLALAPPWARYLLQTHPPPAHCLCEQFNQNVGGKTCHDALLPSFPCWLAESYHIFRTYDNFIATWNFHESIKNYSIFICTF